MVIEYINVKRTVQEDLSLYQTTFEGPLADALWDLDEASVITIAEGILKLPSVVHIEIFDLTDTKIIELGEDIIDSTNEPGVGGFFDSSFAHRFSVTYRREGEQSEVGRGVFTSSSAVVFAKVKPGFLLIIVNAFIKTTALWIIFFIVVKKLLIRPLEILTKATQELRLDRIKEFKVELESNANNELKVLESSFNQMAQELALSTEQLTESNVEIAASKSRLELLFYGTRQMTSAIEKSTSILNAATIISQEMIDLKPTVITIFFQRLVSGVHVFDSQRYSVFDSTSDPIHVSLEPDWVIGAGSLKAKIDQAMQRGESSHIFMIGNQLTLSVWNQNNLLGQIEFECQEAVTVSNDDEQFIETLFQSLIISLEEITIRTELEHTVETRTSELQESKNDLENKAMALEEISRYKSQFLANMSHEIRTPMNAIMGFSHQGARLDDVKISQDYFAKINTASKSLLTIINDILDFSKIESGSLELETIPFSLNDVIEQVIDIVYHDVHSKGLLLLVDCPATVIDQLIGDPTRLRQVIINLISNALKFTDVGCIALKVESRVVHGENVDMHFTITDTGIGIEENKIGDIFKLFSQADLSTTRKYGGTGLGLSISQQLVTLMGGEISVKSTEHEGSHFHFNVHLQCADVQKPLTPIATYFEKQSVLVCGMNKAEVHMLSDLMTSLDFDVNSIASEPVEVVGKYLSYNYGLILVDSDCKSENGMLALLALLDGLAGTVKDKIVILNSPFISAEVKEQYSALGFSKYLNKPLLATGFVNQIADQFQFKDMIKEESVEELDEWWLDGRFKNKRVLVVDDDLINQEVAKALLGVSGISVLTANDGQACLDAMTDQVFDLILMDIQMPVMDGLTAVRKIREQPQYKDLPVVALSAHAMKDDFLKSAEAGMDNHITKPLEIHDLYRALEPLL